MDQLNEAFYILARLNLVKLDEFGYREFSEASLDLAGKLIVKNPKSAKTARALLQRIQIRDDSGDHASYLRLANSLRDQGLYNEAITEYARLGPIVLRSVDSPYKTVLKLWQSIVTSNSMRHIVNISLEIKNLWLTRKCSIRLYKQLKRSMKNLLTAGQMSIPFIS